MSHRTPAAVPVFRESFSRRRRGDEVAIGGDYQHRARTRGPVIQRFWHWEKERIIRRHAAPRAGELVLDVGCGSGVLSDVLAAMGARVVAVDGNPEAIAYASRTFGRRGLEFRRALVEEIDLAPGSVDRIYCLELIEHLYREQVGSLLARFRELLRPGGSVLLTTPNYRGVWPALEWALDRLHLVPQLDGAQHVTRFDAGSLRKVIEDAGLRTERITTFSTFAPFVSPLGWNLANRVADLEDRFSLPFGNVLLAIAARSGGD